MNRNTFLTRMLAFLALPLGAFTPKKAIGEPNSNGFKVKAGQGRKHGHLQLKGVNQNVLDVKIAGTDTQGDLAIFEQTSLSKGRGTPLHVHPKQDEIFYVLQGSYRFQVGDDQYSLSAGETIFLPRAVPHAWTQASEKGKMLVVLQPAGKLEDFFVALAALDHEPSPKEMAHLFARHDMQLVGPPLPLE